MTTAADREGLREARPNEVTNEMLAAAWEVVRDRYPQGRVLGPGPGFREAIAAALALRPLCDLEARIVEAETNAEVDREYAETSRQQTIAALAEVARLSAEVEALKAERDKARDEVAALRCAIRVAADAHRSAEEAARREDERLRKHPIIRGTALAGQDKTEGGHGG